QGAIRPRTGTLNIKLYRQTPPLKQARLCISNVAKQRLVYLGESKKTKKAAAAGSKRPVPSVIYLKPNTSSWLGRAGTIIRRFGYMQAGVLGGGALWLAAALVLAMVALALWAVIRQPDQRAPPTAAEGSGPAIRRQLARIPTAGWICALVALLSALTWSLIV